MDTHPTYMTGKRNAGMHKALVPVEPAFGPELTSLGEVACVRGLVRQLYTKG